MTHVAGAVDDEGRCEHWHGPDDVLAIRLPCCRPYWACHACHGDASDHPVTAWPPEARDADALMCGACGACFSIRRYLTDPDRCPSCGHSFNPRCRRHHPLYFAPGLVP